MRSNNQYYSIYQMRSSRPFTNSAVKYTDMFEAEDNHWWYKGLRYVLLYWITKLKPKHILDTGCGTGATMAYLSKQGYKIRGIDISSVALALARKRGLQKLEIASVQDLPFKNNTFDCILCLDVLGCLSQKELQKAFHEFRRCLKPSGTIIIHVAALAWLYSSQDLSWGIKKRYYKNELQRLCDDHRFRIVTIRYRVFLLFPFIVFLRLLDKVFIRFKRVNPRGDIKKTNHFLDMALTPVMKAEAWLLDYINPPYGSSIFMVARKVS